MTRLALLRDGTAVGCFTLRHHETHVVVVEPNGHAFAHIGPQGRPSRHLTPTLLSSQRTLVATTVRFRNRYAWCTVTEDGSAVLPYVHTALGDTSVLTRRARRRRDGAALSVGWPQLDSYTTLALWREAEQVFQVESLDGAARVQLHASGKLAHAKYLVQIKNETERVATHDEDGFVWVEQTFPVGCAPECFRFPVRLLLRARVARGSGAERFTIESSDREPTASALPQNGALDARPTFRPLQDLPSVTTATRTSPNSFSVESIARWAKGMSRALDRFVVTERADGVDWIVSHDEIAPTVVIVNASDAEDMESARSLIECDRTFFRAFDRQGVVVQQFTADTMPLELTTFNGDFQRTSAILHHAAELFQASCTPQLQSFTGQAMAPSDDASPRLLEDISNDTGRFRAFSDGRVRVVFADRTIVQVAPSEFGDECHFTYRDGSTGRCTSDSASPEQQHYVGIATDFAQWAFATPEQRFRRHQLQTKQQHLVAKELHKISVRHELNNRSSITTNASIRPIRPSETTAGPTTTTTSASLSREDVARLQRETQVHMTHVQTLLEDTHRD